MILTDGTHLVSTKSIRELHLFACVIGLNPCWFSNKRGKNQPHYDIPYKRLSGMLSRAIRKGAKRVSTKYLTENMFRKKMEVK